MSRRVTHGGLPGSFCAALAAKLVGLVPLCREAVVTVDRSLYKSLRDDYPLLVRVGSTDVQLKARLPWKQSFWFTVDKADYEEPECEMTDCERQACAVDWIFMKRTQPRLVLETSQVLEQSLAQDPHLYWGSVFRAVCFGNVGVSLKVKIPELDFSAATVPVTFKTFLMQQEVTEFDRILRGDNLLV